jgi:hypothetical protein
VVIANTCATSDYWVASHFFIILRFKIAKQQALASLLPQLQMRRKPNDGHLNSQNKTSIYRYTTRWVILKLLLNIVHTKTAQFQLISPRLSPLVFVDSANTSGCMASQIQEPTVKIHLGAWPLKTKNPRWLYIYFIIHRFKIPENNGESDGNQMADTSTHKTTKSSKISCILRPSNSNWHCTHTLSPRQNCLCKQWSVNIFFVRSTRRTACWCDEANHL